MCSLALSVFHVMVCSLWVDTKEKTSQQDLWSAQLVWDQMMCCSVIVVCTVFNALQINSHTHMVTRSELLVVYQTAIPLLHSDFTLSSWLFLLICIPPVFVMYLSSHPDAPTTTPIPTTATTTTTTITTTISFPEANQGTVLPSHNLCIFVCMCVWSLLLLHSLDHFIYLHLHATVAVIFICMFRYRWVKVTNCLWSFTIF